MDERLHCGCALILIGACNGCTESCMGRIRGRLRAADGVRSAFFVPFEFVLSRLVRGSCFVSILFREETPLMDTVSFVPLSSRIRRFDSPSCSNGSTSFLSSSRSGSKRRTKPQVLKRGGEGGTIPLPDQHDPAGHVTPTTVRVRHASAPRGPKLAGKEAKEGMGWVEKTT